MRPKPYLQRHRCSPQRLAQAASTTCDRRLLDAVRLAHRATATSVRILPLSDLIEASIVLSVLRDIFPRRCSASISLSRLGNRKLSLQKSLKAGIMNPLMRIPMANDSGQQTKIDR